MPCLLPPVGAYNGQPILLWLDVCMSLELVFAAALSRPDLLAAPVAAALRDLPGAGDVEVAEIDPALAGAREAAWAAEVSAPTARPRAGMAITAVAVIRRPRFMVLPRCRYSQWPSCYGFLDAQRARTVAIRDDVTERY